MSSDGDFIATLTEPAAGGPVREPQLPERYADRGRIAGGAMGEIRRVYDRALRRPLALKVLRAGLVDDPIARQRFLLEAEITAGLQHPGIVPVHESGCFDDGRLWFAMKEIRGETLKSALSRLGRRRLIEAFLRICQAVAYAHSQGVIHRDLKPDNLMIGQFGEVLVLDWGIARRLSEAEPTGEGIPVAPVDGRLTVAGSVMGTPAYMAPEQAAGQQDQVDQRADVYALGATLYEILSGRPPYVSRGAALWRQVLVGEPPPLSGSDLPGELVAICERAMRRDPAGRFADAGELAAAVQDWLDGARRRQQALAVLEAAAGRLSEAERLSAEVARLRAEAEVLLRPLKPYSPESERRPAWALQDRAGALEQEAILAELDWERRVQSALNLVPDLPEAHAALADAYRRRLIEAEERRDPAAAVRYDSLLRSHDRGQHAAWLSGDGAVSLVTEPPGAVVQAHRYREIDRRLVPEPLGTLGTTPLESVRLPRGSYLLTLHLPGHDVVRYPVAIGRGEHWDGVRPGGSAPHPIRLPKSGSLGPDDCYVPAGWFIAGGDPAAYDGLPRQRVWVDGFVVCRFPVTNAQYLAFLNDLMRQGRREEAMAAVPRLTAQEAGGEAPPLYAVSSSGRFSLDEEAHRTYPVNQIDWWGAQAYTRWAAGSAPWRLLDELEWEKAARGVDGRFFPWGDHLEVCWACLLESHAGPPSLSPVRSWPADISPYGVRGMVGNMRDYCGNVWSREGPPVVQGRLLVQAPSTDALEYRAARGGSFASKGSLSRLATRFAARPARRYTGVGMRAAFSWDL